MRHWQIRAVSGHGAVMTFGLRAADRYAARERALERLPFPPCTLTVSEQPPVPALFQRDDEAIRISK